MKPTNPYRNLPQVAKVLDDPAFAVARTNHSASTLASAVRSILDELRSEIERGSATSPVSTSEIAARAVKQLARQDIPTFRTVINATGIVLHTNLGRSPLCESAARAASHAGSGYLNLEMNLDTGKRSSRQDAIRNELCALTGAESATAVNNCAAATVIVLRAVAAGKEVIVSRGQLIEIGGSFRIPEIMAVSGANLKEVGTTNITRISDYERAIGPNTGLLMRIHTSNFRVQGFTRAVELSDLVALGKKHNLPVVDDVGSGALLDLAPFGLPGEPVVSESIRTGADLVLFSGDKLLGGPQAGLIVGKAELIQRIETDPLMRAFRLDKMTLAALEATLRIYRNAERAFREIPTLRMLTTPQSELQDRCERMASRLRAIPVLSVGVHPETAFAGGGSLPEVSFPTVVIAVTPSTINDETFATRLRTGSIPVVGRIQNGKFLIDLRTVFVEQEDNLIKAVIEAISN